MATRRVPVLNTNYEIFEERLSSLCKLFKVGEKEHFAQFYVQAGLLGECIIKGLESPRLPFKERRLLHDAMWSYIHNEMGYEYRAVQRVRDTKTMVLTTQRKSLGRYKR